ncbi:TonB family protein [Galbibacter sp. EGI 63066]|uniref:TonB family protein n=1 Tax=Galbibacter sp. EGI 63066 TaxID=2993559 RepID=UPI002248F163|nr:TonB family protein [Galbibacter sp. EGI 63066]MCX2678783.1 TonB family protein [Galbibacter sp. EGI 63066]
MLNYIIQTLAFQLLFLVIYDFFLKKETFFNWNRAYLLLTPVLSLALPFIKLESLKTTVSENYIFLLPEVVVGSGAETVTKTATSWLPDWTAWEWTLFSGGVLSALWFGYKLIQIIQLKRSGKIHYFKDYTRVEVPKEDTAFSFFQNIFLGKKLMEKEHTHIIDHELVHVKEKHTWDLLFFELLRIVFWFNPLVYIYQNRITELHEFIADAKTVKNNKKEHCKLLLQEAFQTENISFVNQFFNHSLIKKRIVMIQKSKSKKVWQLKYLMLVPLVAGMLFYTSCEKETPVAEEKNISLEDRIQELETLLKDNEIELTAEEKARILSLPSLVEKPEAGILEVLEGKEVKPGTDIPFAVIEDKPMFEKCKGIPNEQQFACFKENLDQHVIRTFIYPEEAQEQGEQGRVYVNFRINTDGTVTILNTRAPSESLDAEARRIINTLPTLNPGRDKNGTPQPVTFAYPIVFKLSDDSQASRNEFKTKDNPAKRKVVASVSQTLPSGYIQGNISNNEIGLPGAHIFVNGTKMGAITNFDGDFKIQAQKGDKVVLQFKDLPQTGFSVREENSYKVIM